MTNTVSAVSSTTSYTPTVALALVGQNCGGSYGRCASGLVCEYFDKINLPDMGGTCVSMDKYKAAHASATAVYTHLPCHGKKDCPREVVCDESGECVEIEVSNGSSGSTGGSTGYDGSIVISSAAASTFSFFAVALAAVMAI
jgi:hypothetical protein